MSDLGALTDRITLNWPGRENQIKQLIGFWRSPGGSFPNLLLYGPASTGKTSITRLILTSLNHKFAYVSCTEFSKPRLLLQSILNQLKAKKRKRSDGYIGSTKNEQMAEFVAEVSGGQALSQAESPRIIVVDHAHRFADQDVLAVLLRLREFTGRRICVVLISHLSWGSGGFACNTLKTPKPIQIHFPAYEAPQIASILATKPPPQVQEYGFEVFKSFLRAEILPTFTRSSRRIEDIQGLVDILFPMYLQPVTDGSVGVSESRKLHANFHNTLLAAKLAFESGSGWRGSLVHLTSKSQREQATSKANDLGFELPYYSKFLLLSAYICSRNKPTLDRRLFDLRSKSGKRHGQMSHDKQMENAKEAALRGPHSFPLERMLAVFWHLQRNEDDSDLVDAPYDAELFMQISSLVSLQFLTKVSSDDLEAKFRCNVSESTATIIAKNLSLRLTDYVLYA